MGTITVQGVTTATDVSSSGYNSQTSGWTGGAILRWEGIVPNPGGQIVLALTPDNNHTIFLNAMQLTAIPEPSTYAAILGVCALVLLIARRRRR